MASSSIVSRYRQLLSDLENLPTAAGTLTAPLFVKIDASQKWRAATKRVLFVGQETRDWGWLSERSLQETVLTPDALDLLLDAYKKFDFGREYPKLASAPFWRFFYHLEKNADCGILWTNVLKTTGKRGGSHSFRNLSLSTQSEILKWQHGILVAEIDAFDPTHIIFVTGPDYDGYIQSEIGPCSFVTFDNGPSNQRQLAVLDSPRVKLPMMRTYHPGYLNRKGRFEEMLRYASGFLAGDAK